MHRVEESRKDEGQARESGAAGARDRIHGGPPKGLSVPFSHHPRDPNSMVFALLIPHCWLHLEAQLLPRKPYWKAFFSSVDTH